MMLAAALRCSAAPHRQFARFAARCAASTTRGGAFGSSAAGRCSVAGGLLHRVVLLVPRGGGGARLQARSRCTFAAGDGPVARALRTRDRHQQQAMWRGPLRPQGSRRQLAQQAKNETGAGSSKPNAGKAVGSSADAAAAVSKSGSAAGTEWYRTSLAKHGLIVGGLVGAATYIAYNFTGFIMSFNPRYWVYLGFLGGTTVAALVAFATSYVVRNVTILPENVFRQAVRVLGSNTFVKKELGGVAADVASVKAYHIDRGFVGFRNGRFRWFHPNVQMMFRIDDPSDAGTKPVIAYVDAQRTAVGLQLLNVAVVRPHPERGFAAPEVVQVVGTDEDIATRQDLRDTLFKSKHSFLHSVPRYEEAVTA